MSNALTKVAPEVITLARPIARLLLAARQVAQRKPELQEVFRLSKEEGWPAETLALHLEEPLQGLLETDDPQEVVQVARYLADEYQQMGDTMLLISRETGKAIGRISEEDIWQPDPVPRDGTMAVPMPRLRPELEAFLIKWHFDKGYEEKLVQDIVPRLHQTDLLKEEGDPRLLPVTRAGRATLVDQVRANLPRILIRATRSSSGSVGQFLRHFDVVTEDPIGSPYEPLLRCTAIARTRTGIQDALAMNLKFDRLEHLYGAVGNSWVREIARTLAISAKKYLAPPPREYTTLTDEDAEGVFVWVGAPDFLHPLREAFRRPLTVLPVDHAPLTALRGKVGAIVINEQAYECKGRELSDRWEVGAKLEYTLWVDWSEIRSFDLTDAPSFATAVVQTRRG